MLKLEKLFAFGYKFIARKWTKGRRDTNFGDCNIYQSISSSYPHKVIEIEIYQLFEHDLRNKIHLL